MGRDLDLKFGDAPADHRDVAATLARPASRRAKPGARTRTARRLGRGPALAAFVALPGALMLWFGFQAGGFFPSAPALGAVVLALVLLVRATTAERPFAGIGRAAAVAGGALALFAVWTLLSAYWSDAPTRALIEWDRALLYLLVFVLCASLPRSEERLAWMVRGVALSTVVLCSVGLIARTLPGLWGLDVEVARDRLSYPLTYWNAMGLVAALGLVLCVHLASSDREPRWSRPLGAAAVPLLATALYFTFSRGAMVAAALALLAYVVLGRPRGLLTAALAILPAAALALSSSYGAEALAQGIPAGPVALAEGTRVAAIVALCAAGAGALRLLLLPVDDGLARLRLPPRARRPLAVAGILALLVVPAVAAVALDVPARAAAQYERFSAGDNLTSGDDLRGRLTDAGNNGRVEHWTVALDAFAAEPLHGAGAGTYALLWDRDRTSTFTVIDGHSLYLEVLAELGGVGFGLLAIALGTVLLVMLTRCRGRDRALFAALLGAGAAWALHAGIDWDWEMPAVTLPFFALGGAALAVPSSGRRGPAGRPPRRLTRLLLGVGCLLLALTPASVWLSQRELADAVTAFKAGDCRRAVDSSLDSVGVLGARPEPFEVLGYCNVRTGDDRLAVRAMDNAVRRDPANWEMHYGSALVRGAVGLDPRPALREAVRLNPRERLLEQAGEILTLENRKMWRRSARALPLTIR